MKHLILTLSAFLFCSTVIAGSKPPMRDAATTSFLTLLWDEDDTGVTGYKALYGTVSGNYTQEQVIIGDIRFAVIENLDTSQRWYFAVKAYRGTAESLLSPELAFSFPSATPAPTITPTPTPTATATATVTPVRTPSPTPTVTATATVTPTATSTATASATATSTPTATATATSTATPKTSPTPAKTPSPSPTRPPHPIRLRIGTPTPSPTK